MRGWAERHAWAITFSLFGFSWALSTATAIWLVCK